MTYGIRVVVVHVDEIVREGIATLLRRDARVGVAVEAGTVASGATAAQRYEARVVVSGQLLEGQHDVIDLVRALKERQLRARVVALAEPRHSTRLQQAVEAGELEIVRFDVAPQQLLETVAGEARAQKPDAPTDHRSAPARLTSSQKEILAMLVSGRTLLDVAAATGRSAATVNSYMRDAYTRLGVRSRSEALAAAIRLGFI